MYETKQFVCEQCGTSFDVSLPDVIDTEKQPQDAVSVMHGSIFLKSCPECGHRNLILWEFFYKNPKNGYVLHLCEKGNIQKESLRDTYLKQRIVYEPVELIEKIYIFDQGLDDRVIEIMKLMNLFVIADEKKADISDIVFSPDKNGNNHFLFMSGDEEYGTTAFNKEMYDDIRDTFVTNVAPELAISERVDDRWALHAVKRDTMLS